MLTDRDGMFFTQREVPKMAAITVAVTSNGLRVTSEAEGEMSIPFEPDRATRQRVTVWQSQVEGLVYSGSVSEWFSDVLGRACQLVLMPESTERRVSEQFDLGEDTVSFADGFPLLLIGEASLEYLNDRIRNGMSEGDRESFVPFPMNRFRPSIVVKESNAFDEDNWAKIKVGEAVFRVVKPCGRCVMTTVDQDRGEFAGKEPLKTLAAFRMAKELRPDTFEQFGHGPTSVLFGENLIPENPGAQIRIGDNVEVLQKR